MKMRSKNSGAKAKKEDENPFLVNDPEVVWETWKKNGKPISREELALKIKEAARLQRKENH